MNLSKYVALSILIIIFVFDLTYAEDKEYGFKDIPFGTSYEEVKQKLEATYIKMHHTYRFGKGFSGKDYISFNHFDLGDNQIEVQATFNFDHNGKFYRFSFDTEWRTATLFNTKIYEEGMYLTRVFKSKYGEPSKCYKPDILTVRSNHIATLCEWKHKDLKISIDFISLEGNFYAVAHVASKKLEDEYNSYKKQQENKSASDGAKKF